MKRCAFGFAALFLSGICTSIFSHAEDSAPAPLPLKWSVESTDALADAYQAWDWGADYFKDQAAEDLVLLELKEEHFTRFDAKTKSFLEYPKLQPGVSSGCCRYLCPMEQALTDALDDAKDPLRQLQALVLLMKVRSPSTVARQWTTLQQLKTRDLGARGKELLKKLEYTFSPAVLKSRLASIQEELLLTPEAKAKLPQMPETTNPWVLQAVGVTQCKEFLPVLRELSIQPDYHIAVNAESAIDRFEGPDAEAALAYCVKSWQYEASDRAARALLKRNLALYKQTLFEIGPPTTRLNKYAFMLAEIEDARCVPMFCDIVQSKMYSHRGIFYQIERFARLEDIPLIKELPEKVPDEDKADAKLMLKRVLQRFQ